MNDLFNRPELIGKFTDDELDREEENSLLYAASKNSLLRNELRLDRQLNELLGDDLRMTLSENIYTVMSEIKKKNRVADYSVFRYAAAVILLVAIGFYLVYALNIHSGQTDEMISRSAMAMKKETSGILDLLKNKGGDKPVSSPVKRRLIAQDNLLFNEYTPRPEYEFLIGAVTRDQSLLILDPLPRINCTRDSVIRFSWLCTGPFVSPVIEVSNNQGQVIYITQPLTDVPFLLEAARLGKGLFYYKIMIKDELVTLGSIEIY